MTLSLKLGLVYFASEILLTITRRSRSKTGVKQDKSTLGMIWVVIGLSITAGGFVARSSFLWDHGVWMFQMPSGPALGVAAVGLFAAGLLLRWWAIVTLGRFFTVDVTIEKDHQLVERGPFRWVRHPSYTGVLLAFVGVGVNVAELGGDGGRAGADRGGVREADEGGGRRAGERPRVALCRLHETD